MLDHVFTDAITALREAFEAALLERQAFEEHFQVDVLLGDVVWETSYGLPGEGLPPRVVAHITFDWPTWSQTSYRRWYIEEALDEHPAIEMEIVFRVQRLADQPDPALFEAVMPEASPPIGNERLERAGSTVEIGYLQRGRGRGRLRHRGHLRGALRAGRGDAGRRRQQAARRALLGARRLDRVRCWCASGDVRVPFLPPDESEVTASGSAQRSELGAHGLEGLDHLLARWPRPAGRRRPGSGGSRRRPAPA